MLLKKFVNVSREVKPACTKHAFVSTFIVRYHDQPSDWLPLANLYSIAKSEIREAFRFLMIQKVSPLKPLSWGIHFCAGFVGILVKRAAGLFCFCQRFNHADIPW